MNTSCPNTRFTHWLLGIRKYMYTGMSIFIPVVFLSINKGREIREERLMKFERLFMLCPI